VISIYWALAIFCFIVSLSGFAMVLGNTPENDSGVVVLVCSTVIGVAALAGLIVSVVLIKRDRQPKQREIEGR